MLNLQMSHSKELAHMLIQSLRVVFILVLLIFKNLHWTGMLFAKRANPYVNAFSQMERLQVKCVQISKWKMVGQSNFSQRTKS
uniref:Uncharacterized protein n=1 Tax=Anguilla anguilla TaxID=7936 RepID=A0A0E9RC93_ANGAN